MTVKFVWGDDRGPQLAVYVDQPVPSVGDVVEITSGAHPGRYTVAALVWSPGTLTVRVILT
ncbi:MAG: hypothetical protein ACO1SV_05475 [Fimbriimonas sp.]